MAKLPDVVTFEGLRDTLNQWDREVREAIRVTIMAMKPGDEVEIWRAGAVVSAQMEQHRRETEQSDINEGAALEARMRRGWRHK